MAAGDDSPEGSYGGQAQARPGWLWLLPQAATPRGALVAGAYYTLSLLPAVAVGSPAAVRAYWLGSSLALATGVLWLHGRGGLTRVAAFAFNVVAALGNLLLAVSLAIQGTGFNAQFFYHLDFETLLAAKDAFASLTVLGATYALLVSVWPVFLPNVRVTALPAKARWARAGVIVLVVAATLNAALLSLVWYVGAELLRRHRIVLVPKPGIEVVAAPAADMRSLVLVVAESLEATYSRVDLVGTDLTPSLSSLSADATRFADMRQVSHTGWTAGALVAASCGMPMAPASYFRQRTPGAEARMPGAVCLGDVLAAHGYRTVFMVGHSLAFAGLDDFLAVHGFVERHGFAALREQLAVPSYRSGWGLFDDSLLALARTKLRELAAGEGPFALVVLTMDTHFPPGFPSASCGGRDDPDDRAFVIRCADRLVTSFIADVRAEVPDAVVALYSDHLSQESPSRAGLVPPGSSLAGDDAGGIVGLVHMARGPGLRRLRFAVWDPARPPEVVQRPGTHFDIMPTILDFVGIDGWAVHGFGASLLRGSSPWLAHPNPDALQIVQELPTLRLDPGDIVSFDAGGPTMEIDGERLLATGRGLSFEDAVFALAVGRDGTVAEVLDADAFAAVAGGVDPPAVVGLSSRHETNRRLLVAAGEDAEPAPALIFFAGRPGTPDFVAGDFSSGETRTVSVRY